MKNLVIPLLALASLSTSLAASAETIYLLIKSETDGHRESGIALHSLPMKSREQCEEAGALIIASVRLDTKHSKGDGFECIVGK